MGEKEDDVTSEPADSAEIISGLDGVTVGENEQQARDRWLVYFADRGIHKAVHMITYVENNPDINDQIVSDVIAGIQKDREAKNGII